MKKAIVAVVALVALGVIAGAAYRTGWLNQLSRGTVPSVPSAGGAAPAASAGGPAGNAATPTAPGVAGAVPASLAAPVFDGNVASAEFGGTVEKSTDTNSHRFDQILDGDRETCWETFGDEGDAAPEIVLSFFAREPVLIDGVVIQNSDDEEYRSPKAVEVLVSSASPDGPFTKVAAADVPMVKDVTVKFDPVEARFLKLRFLKNHRDAMQLRVADVKVHEAQRAGYVPLTTRHPELVQAGGPGATRDGLQATATATMAPSCAPEDANVPNPAHTESKRVLVIAPNDSAYQVPPSPLPTSEKAALDRRAAGAPEFGILGRVQITRIDPRAASPAMLAPAIGYDTVVLAQVCETGQMPASFRQALIPWVAAGHKLIMQDSDDCGSTGPDYGFLPYRFKTNNPGAQGAQGKDLLFVEQNYMAHGRRGREGYINVAGWVDNTDLYKNELGDSNTIVEWDPHWCGHMAVRNINDVFGFTVAYAHHGRGLVIYDGLDNDQGDTFGYDMVLARELAVGFDPDNLPCTARMGDFIVTTDSTLTERPMVPGRTYTYPLRLLSNQGYKGNIALSVSASPAIDGLQHRVDPGQLSLTDVAQTALTLSLPSGARQAPLAVEVKGTDTTGKSNSLCLHLVPPRTGELAVASEMRQAKVQKNLEIILDASGSMKTLMGKKSRWQTALDTLQQVVTRLPDDFKVGLRIYGHRESSRSPNTCTDSELVAAIGPLDRAGIMNAANAVKPKGETPLVYSVLQAPADLKAVGGGTVVLITDGEESCRGDAVKAAAELKASGVDVTLSIIGFAVQNNAALQKQLGGFATATGGRFYSAENGPALAQALLLAAIDKFPFVVYDSGGKQVLSGEAGDPAEELPPGDYKVVVKAGAQEVVAQHVKVALGQSVLVAIRIKNGTLVLEQ